LKREWAENSCLESDRFAMDALVNFKIKKVTTVVTREKDELAAMVTERVYKKLEKLVADRLNVDVEDIVYETIKEMKLEEKSEKL